MRKGDIVQSRDLRYGRGSKLRWVGVVVTSPNKGAVLIRWTAGPLEGKEARPVTESLQVVR